MINRYLEKLKQYKLIATSYKLNRGMTYVELIVVLSIFSILSAVSIFNYGDFQAKVDLKNLASDIALQITQAQHSALNGVFPTQSVAASWKPAYGVYFNSSSNTSFIYFVDLDNNNLYAGAPSCSTLECLNNINITRNNTISRLDIFYQSAPAVPVSYGDLTVAFSRPSSGAFINATGVSSPSTIDHAQITVTSPKGLITTIKVYPSGRIQVN